MDAPFEVFMPGTWVAVGIAAPGHWLVFIRGEGDWSTEGSLSRADYKGMPYCAGSRAESVSGSDR